MKRILVLILALSILLCGTAFAADWTAYSTEELQTMMQEISAEIASRLRPAADSAPVHSGNETVMPDAPLGQIADLFPDEVFAKTIRDSIGRFSVEDTVTQADLDKVTSLYIAGNNNNKIYDLTGIGYLRQLTHLSLYNDCYQGAVLPEELYALNNLTYLRIGGGNLSEISPMIGSLTNLTTLEIVATRITSLPDTVGNLIYLKELSVAINNLTALPESVGDLIYLRTLEINRNKITSLPDSIVHLVNLESLRAYSNPISALPDNIGDMISLKVLNLNDTDISFLPDSIGNLAGLKELYISRTRITALPDSLRNLNLEKFGMEGLPIQ